MITDRPLLGIGFMLGFCLLAPLGDALAKLLGSAIPLGELLAVRFGAQVLLLLPIMWWTGRSFALKGRLLWLVVLRTILHIIGIGMMFLSLRFLPLADALAIAFVFPFILLLLGWRVLGEYVGTRRLVACLVGFAGSLLVIQPSFLAVGSPALLPLGVAVLFALFMLITRKIAKEIDAIRLQGISGLIAMALFATLYFVSGRINMPEMNLIVPNLRTALLLMSMGVVGTLAHLMMTWSLRFAPSATLAPMQYLEIPVATLLGLWIFDELPNGLAAVGIAVTMAAGLYVILRERTLANLPMQKADFQA